MVIAPIVIVLGMFGLLLATNATHNAYKKERQQENLQKKVFIR